MPRPEINRSGEMEVFVRVVELGGFSAAARAGQMTPSAVSKLMSRLEARLGARLLHRSTRKLQLTPEGSAFYERATRILADLEEAERGVSSAERAAGRIRLNVNASFGTHILAPLLPDFLAQYPDVTLDIVQTDTVVNLLEARADVAVRAGPLKSSSLVARKLGATRMVIVAAPVYLERHGTPDSIEALERHNRLRLGYTRSLEGWPLLRDGTAMTLPAVGRVQISDGEALRQLVLEGTGLARLAAFTVRDDIRAGRLVPVMEDHNPGDLEEVHAVWLGQGGQLPARIRALLDFLAVRGRVG
ncbi:LysR family transcriptional regulator [Roseomonas aerophila]|uniref:LysR family transcriptional regulator n=1 Tax=Teichococcus aerophilus TaxID=1224513 RepID=A0ABR7RP77_9PROT|nr:LysR family transcriptional regulator [Pseudoroseomonas aerophila]MBC9208106.1 LysR family transcriptional regulator [Pseudoroseomonas aerophila]